MKRKTETVAAPEIASPEVVGAAVGARIRALRRSKGLGLNEMADRTGLSIGFLSQMERGLSSPTLRALTSLADAMQVNLAEIVRGPTVSQPAVPVITRAGERSSISMWKSGIRKHALASGGAASSAFSFTLLEFEPRASSGYELYTHQGEEAGYVLQGRLKLVVNDKEWTLAAGDSFHFSSELPHRFENASTRQLIIVMVNARA